MYQSHRLIRGLPLFLIDIIINVDWDYASVDSKEGFSVDKFFMYDSLPCNFRMIFTEKFSNVSSGKSSFLLSLKLLIL